MRTGVPVAHPRLPVGEAVELLRASSYPLIPVGRVALASSSAERAWGASPQIDGWVNEAEITRALLAASDETARKALMQTPLADVPGEISA